MKNRKTDYEKNEDKFFNLLYPGINSILEKFGFEHRIIRACPTKITTYDGKTRIGDFIGFLDNEEIINVEAHSTAITNEDKEKFFDYASYLRIRYRRKVHTLVLSSHYKDNNSVILNWHSTSPFTIPYKSFNTLNAEKTINRINFKNRNKEKLDDSEIADLRILTFMKSEKSHKELLIESVKLTNEAVMDQTEREYTKTLQSYLARKFIRDDMEFKEVMKMIERNSEELNGVFDRYHRVMIDDVREEVREEVKEEVKEDLREELREELQKEKEEEDKIKIENMINEMKKRGMNEEDIEAISQLAK